MIRYRRKLLVDAIKLFDLIAMIFYFLFAALIYSFEEGRVSFSHVLAIRIKVSNLLIFMIFLLVWHVLFSFFKLYHSQRLTSLSENMLQILKATTSGTCMMLIAAFLFNIRLINGYFLLLFWGAATLGTMGCRLMLRFIQEKIRKRGRNLRNILIVGSSGRALRFAERILNTPGFGYQLLGFVDEGSGMSGFEKSGYHLMTDLAGLPAIIRVSVVDEVVICLPLKSYYQEISQIVSECEKQGILVRFLPDIFNLKLGRSQLEQSDEGSFISISTGRMKESLVLVKYGIDFITSLLMLFVLSPVLMATAIVIKMTSNGPVFFVQDRVGFHKRLFPLYKFRTMVADAEARITALEEQNEVDGPAFKIKNDPRVTGIGKFLRKTSIDELPQLINVLKGEMSLVGPRPLPIRDYNGFDQDWHRRRFSVKPGMTCIWQVSGRNNISFSDWMKMDMDYIDNWTLWLDFKILIKTIPVALLGAGAS